MSAELAVAVSVYDKFDDVRIISDIVRSWDRPVFFAVCSNHPDPLPHLKNCDMDAFVQGAPFPWNPGMPNPLGRISITARLLDQMKKLGKLCMDSGAPYTLHINANAWPLQWDGIARILDDMRERRKVFAARGPGFGLYHRTAPLGGLDDNFFFFDNAFARENRLWEFDSLGMHLHKINIHGFLTLLVVMRVGMNRFLLYSDYSGTQIWDGRPHPLWPRDTGKPSSFDPVNHLLYVHTAAFPDDLGKRVQAMYLSRYGLIEGHFIPDFLECYYLPEQELLARLATEEASVNRELRATGRTLEDLGFDFSIAEWLVSQPSKSLWKRLNIPRKGFKALEQVVHTISRGKAKLVPVSKLQQLGMDFDRPALFADSFWPEDVATRYKDVDPDIFGEIPWWDQYQMPPSGGHQE